MKARILKIECITDLHVGNGDANFNIVDKEVEKDLVGYPTINSSGVKGALREYFNQIKENENFINDVFGTGDAQGQIKFLSADLVSIPARKEDGSATYEMVHTQMICDRVKKIFETFGLNESDPVHLFSSKSLLIDDYKSRVVLPIIARNHLENGKSVNLFYEERVPRDTIFMLPLVSENEKLLNDFVKMLDKKIVQIGGNASIGCGLCKITIIC